MKTTKPGLTPELESIYADIAAAVDSQRSNFVAWLDEKGEPFKKSVVEVLHSLGLAVDLSTGKLQYLHSFQPLDIKYELCYIRHGKTDGNTEPRVYQGQVDYLNNALIDVGEEQARTAAEAMSKSSFHPPHLVLLSPLSRAANTGRAYTSKYLSRDVPVQEDWSLVEQAFGSWDNVEVRCLPKDSICHLFYLDQNAVVKANKPHHDTQRGKDVPAENFVDLLARIKASLLKINEHPVVKAVLEKGLKPKVAIYGHSMAGAATMVLLGHGKRSPEGTLGFDGSYIMPNATPTMLSPKKPE